MPTFQDFTRNYKRAGLWLMRGVIAVPLVGLLADIVPTWPGRVTVTGLSCVFEVVLLMYASLAWSKHPQARLRRRMLWASAAGVVLLVGYAVLFSTFTVDTRFDGRVTIGYEFLSETHAKLAARRSLRDLLADVPGSDVLAIWTAGSVAVVRASILILWLAFLTSICMIVASFSIAEEQRKKTAASAGKPPSKPKPAKKPASR